MSEMFITPIQPMNLAERAETTQKVSGQEGTSIFRSIFDEAIGNVKSTEDDLVEKQYLLATGQIEDAHSVPIAAAEAQLAVDLLVSLRNKALESYNELMRISV